MSTNEAPKLHLSEIKPEATLSIIASLGNKKMELPVEYANLSMEEYEELTSKYENRFLPLENILKEIQNHLQEIDFSGSLSSLELIAITKNGIFHWENVKIAKYSFASGKRIYLATCRRLEGEKYNRRRGVRINIDKMMDIEQGENTYSVLVRDLSYCGVAFIEKSGAQIDPEQEFILHLIDSDDEGEEYLVGRIHGRVNNRKDYEGGGILNGCVISANHAAFLQRYIAAKQLEAIRGKKPSKKLQQNMTGEYWQEDMADALKKIE